MPVRVKQHAFTAGEVAPDLFEREDSPQLKQAVFRARNVITTPQGGIRRRSGTGVQALVSTGSTVERAFPIEVSSTAEYAAIFKSTELRIYDVGGAGSTLDATLTNSTSDFQYPFEGLDLTLLDGVAAFDTLTVTHPHESVGPYTLTRQGYKAWKIAEFAYELVDNEPGSTGASQDIEVNKPMVKYAPGDMTIQAIGGTGVGSTGTFHTSTRAFLAGHVGTIIDYVNSTSDLTIRAQAEVLALGVCTGADGLTATAGTVSSNYAVPISIGTAYLSSGDNRFWFQSTTSLASALAGFLLPGDFIGVFSISGTGISSGAAQATNYYTGGMGAHSALVVEIRATAVSTAVSGSSMPYFPLAKGWPGTSQAVGGTTSGLFRLANGLASSLGYDGTNSSGSTIVYGINSSFTVDFIPGDRVFFTTAGGQPTAQLVYQVVSDTELHLLYPSISTYTTTGDLSREYGSGSTVVTIRPIGDGGTTAAVSGLTSLWREQVASAARGQFGAVALHQGRLVFGRTASAPDIIAISKVGQTTNFDEGETLADEAIILTSSIPRTANVRHIVSQTDMLVLTDAGVAFDNNSPMTPGNATLRNAEELPAGKAKPVKLEGGVVFISEAGGETRARVHELLYNDATLAYEPQDLTLLAPHLINTPVAMAVRRGNDQVSADHIFIVNNGANTNVGISSAGSVAVLNTLRSQQITGWTLWEMGLGGSTRARVLDIANVGGDIFFLTDRDGNVWLEKLSDTYTLDAATKQTISTDLTGSVTFSSGSQTVTGTGTLFNTELSTGNWIYLSTDGIDYVAQIATITDSENLTLGSGYTGRSTTGTATLASTSFTISTSATPWSSGDSLQLKADGEYIGSVTVSTNNTLDVGRAGSTVEYGAGFSWQVVLLPVEVETGQGVTSNRLRRVVEADVSVQDTRELSVRKYSTGTERAVTFSQSTAGPGLAKNTSRQRIVLNGYARDYQIELFGDDAQEAHIRSVVMEIV